MCVIRLFSDINVLKWVVCVGGVFIQVTCVNREQESQFPATFQVEGHLK